MPQVHLCSKKIYNANTGKFAPFQKFIVFNQSYFIILLSSQVYEMDLVSSV